MRTKLIFLSILFFAASAAAYKLEIIIAPGPGLTRLADLCTWVRADESYPTMTDNECGERLFLRGAFELNHEKMLQELRADGRIALADEDAAFWADLPMPPPGPTATPTASPTVTPTVTPTISPTASPTVSPTPAP